MRKLFALIAVLSMLTIGASKLIAQEEEAAAPAEQTEQITTSSKYFNACCYQTEIH